MNSIKAANQVLQRTNEYIGSGLVRNLPAWYKVLAFNPPRHAFNKTIRPEVLEQRKQEEISSLKEMNEKLDTGFYATRIKTQKKDPVNKLTRSQQLKFIEDDLRLLFYKQHPWELADPKNLIENESNLGNDKFDWSHLRQFGKKLDGESVVQRTLYLVETEDKTLLQAYEQAKSEYYRLQIQDETEMNICREESEMCGAVYPTTIIEKGFAKEAEVLAKWKLDAMEQTKIFAAKHSNSDSSATSSADTTLHKKTELSEDDIFKALEAKP